MRCGPFRTRQSIILFCVLCPKYVAFLWHFFDFFDFIFLLTVWSCLASSSIIENFLLFWPSVSLCDLCATFCVVVRSRVSPTVLMYSLFPLSNIYILHFKEAEREHFRGEVTVENKDLTWKMYDFSTFKESHFSICHKIIFIFCNVYSSFHYVVVGLFKWSHYPSKSCGLAVKSQNVANCYYQHSLSHWNMLVMTISRLLPSK